MVAPDPFIVDAFVAAFRVTALLLVYRPAFEKFRFA